ncbi:MAG: hypothetical protein ABH845_06845 [Candidatus Omnitrophota bacterium]
MITLDLLPPEYQRKKAPTTVNRIPGIAKLPFQRLTKIPLRTVYLYGGGSLLILYTLVFLGIVITNLSLNGLKKGMEQIAPERDRITKLAKEYNELQVIDKALQELEQQFSWSKKLQQLSSSLVGGVWLNELSLSKRQGEETQQGTKAIQENILVLAGSAASPRGDQIAQVGRFIRSLKENSGFFSDFSSVELESSKRRTIQAIEVMDFKIICTFREGVLD